MGYQKAFETGTIRALINLSVPSKIPLHGSESYAELASQTGVSEALIKRLIELAAVSGFLAAEGNDRVRHNATSFIFVRRLLSAAEGTEWNLEVSFRPEVRIYEGL